MTQARVVTWIGTACLCFCAGARAFSPSILVTNLNDSGPGSLRDAVLSSTASDAIGFDAGLTGTIALSSPIAVTHQLTIAGPGADVITLSGQDACGILTVDGGKLTVWHLTFSNGKADRGAAILVQPAGTLWAENCVFSSNQADTGGAVCLTTTNTRVARLAQCLFANNTAAYYGGAVYAENGTELTVNSCQFSNNSADRGGAVAGFASFPILQYCRLEHNHANNGGGAVSLDLGTSLSMVGCVLSGNVSDKFGGAVIVTYSGPSAIWSSSFMGNLEGGQFGGFGGGSCAYVLGTELDIINSVLVGNQCLGRAQAAVFANGKTVSLLNCTVAGNLTQEGDAGGVYAREASTHLDITNTILWGNRAASWRSVQQSQVSLAFDSTLSVNYSDMEGWDGGLGGTGNIGTDPRFFKPAVGNVRLADGSPCIDAGDNGVVPGALVTDVVGNGRIVDDPAVADTGNGTAPIVDMGAYEHVGGTDCNGNGVLDSTDLTNGSADLNGNLVPDECEDCNGNLVPDDMDIANHTSADCNGNTSPDECDIAARTSQDCDGNNIPDECDIQSKTVADCNGNGVPDACDIASQSSPDCNGNQIPDECDIAAQTSQDCNGNNIPDECDLTETVSSEAWSGSDAAGWQAGNIVSEIAFVGAGGNPGGYLQVRSDLTLSAIADGSASGGGFVQPFETRHVRRVAFDARLDSGDFIDLQVRLRPSMFGNGWLHTLAGPYPLGSWQHYELHIDPAWTDAAAANAGWVREPLSPSWQDTMAGLYTFGIQAHVAGPSQLSLDNVTLGMTGATDCNGNRIPDSCDIANHTSEDCDANGVPDECDPDCNGNHHPDACDIAGQVSQDCNGNGIPDECDISGQASQDCNANQIPDECDIASLTSDDCDANSVPDECDIAGGASDCNGNHVPDVCDLASVASRDCNGNDVPDECDVAGGADDCNHNGVPDECDLRADLLAISDSGDLRLFTVDPAGVLSPVASLNPTVDNTNGLARDPATGVLYAVVSRGKSRELVTLDMATGTMVTVGKLSEAISDIACSGDGTLYGVVGNAPPAALDSGDIVTISKTDASLTFSGLKTGPRGGRSLAFRPGTTLLYHVRMDDATGQVWLDAIDLTARTVTPISNGQSLYLEFQAAAFDAAGAHLIGSSRGTLFEIDPATGDCRQLQDTVYQGDYKTFTGMLFLAPGSSDCNGNQVPDECDADGDGDHVPDTCDQCPADPAKTVPGNCGCGAPEVDGCGTVPGDASGDDADGDGVPDTGDTCPGTGAGVLVDATGCPVSADGDQDGVIDSVDLCPDTAASLAVDSVGCPLTPSDPGDSGSPVPTTGEGETEQQQPDLYCLLCGFGCPQAVLMVVAGLGVMRFAPRRRR